MQSNWFEHYFQGLAVDLWRQVTTPEMTQPEVDFIERELRLKPGGRVLDIPCGGGRHAIELASRGYCVTGLDLSTEFLFHAREDAVRRTVSVEWVQSDMRNVPRGPFDGAYCFGNSFGYLVHEDTVGFLSSLAASLQPGARFALQTGMTAETLLPQFQPKSEYTVGEIRMTTERSYRPEDSRMVARYTFEQGDRKEVHDMEQSIYTCGEFHRMLRKSGLEPKAVYSDTNREPFRFGARGLILIAEKVS